MCTTTCGKLWRLHASGHESPCTVPDETSITLRLKRCTYTQGFQVNVIFPAKEECLLTVLLYVFPCHSSSFFFLHSWGQGTFRVKSTTTFPSRKVSRLRSTVQRTNRGVSYTRGDTLNIHCERRVGETQVEMRRVYFELASTIFHFACSQGLETG